MRLTRLVLGKTKEEANETLKNLGYFVCDSSETLRYQNQIPVRCEEGKIVAVEEGGKWRDTIDEG